MLNLQPKLRSWRDAMSSQSPLNALA